MESKLTIEELEKQCLEAEETFKTLHDLLTKARMEEEAAKKEKLRAEKDARYKEVIEAYKHADALRDAVVEDYGSFTFETDTGLFSIRNLLFRD